MPIQQFDLGKGIDFNPLQTIATLSRQRTAQDQESQLNAAHLQQIAMQIQESKRKLDEENAVKKIVSEGGDPQEVYKKLLAVNPDTARTYLTNSQADVLQQQQQADQRVKDLQGSVAPGADVATPQTTTAPIQTSLTDPSQMSAPQVSDPGTARAEAPLPAVTKNYIGQPSAVLQPQSKYQLYQAAKQKFQDELDAKAQAKIAEENATVHTVAPDTKLVKGSGEVIATGAAKPKPLKFNSNGATGGLETIEDPNSGTTYHAGNIATAPPEIKAAWDSIQGQQASQRSYKETEAGKRDQELIARQTTAFENAIKKSEFDSAQKVVTAANGDYQSAIDRVKTMERNRASALAKGDQQAMLSLLTNHIGMTLGAQKGARITQAILDEAAQSAPWLQKIVSKFDGRGYLSGVTLAPEQMQFMVELAHERANDLLEHKQRIETEYHDALSVGRKSATGKSADPLGIR